jgi:FecR protein
MQPKKLWLAAVLVCGVTHAAEAASKNIGSAIKIVNLVTAEFNRDTRSLITGDGVRQNETIEVGSDGSGELLFNDDTKLALGPDSELVLDKFVYDPDKSTGSIILEMAKGSFRFITGIATKRSYEIRIPNASITVRGTIFDGYLQDDGTAWVLLHEGAVEICNKSKKCQLHDEPGKLIRVTSSGDVGSMVKWASLPKNDAAPFDTAFPFVTKSPSFDPTPLLTRDVIILGKLPEKDPPPAVNEEKPNKKKVHKKKRKKKKVYKKKRKKKKVRKAKKKGLSNEDIAKGVGLAVGIGIGLSKIGKNKGGGHQGGHPGKY